MSSIGLPALNGFIGEILILQGVYVVNKMWAAVAASGIVLGAAYMLWLYQRTMFGKIENPANANLKDLNVREFMTFAPLIALAVWIGIFPTPILKRLEPAVNRVVMRVNADKYGPAIARATDCTTPGATTAAGPTGVAAPPGFAMAAPCTSTEPAPAAAAPIKQDGGTH